MVQSALRASIAVAALFLVFTTPTAAQDDLSFRPVLEAILKGDLSGTHMPPFDVGGKARHVDIVSLLSRETTLWVAAAPALMRTRQPDRRHLVVALSDGYDTISTLTIEAVESIARRTDSMLYIVLPYASGTGKIPELPSRADTRLRWAMPRYHVAPSVGVIRGRHVVSTPPGEVEILELKALAELTGGEFDRVFATPGGLPALLKEVLEKFRYSYVLRYRASGVKREGWHDVTVRLPNHPGVEIRARKGYFGG